MSGARTFTLFAIIAAIAAPGSASAGVDWRAPAECGDAAGLGARIDAQLGRPLGAGELDAKVTIAASDGEYRATLALDESGAPRELIGASCGEVVDAAAFVLAVAVRDAEQARAGAPVDRTPRAPRVWPQLDLGVGLTADATTLPGPTVGLDLGVGLTRGRWSLRSGVGLWYPRTANADMLAATEVKLVSGSLALCRAIGPVRACGAASGGPMTGTGLEGADRTSARRWSAGVGLAAAVRHSLGRRIALEAGVEALVAVARPRFVFDSGAEGYRARAGTIRARVTLTANLFGEP